MILRNITICHQPIEWRVTDISQYCGGGDVKLKNTQVVAVTRPISSGQVVTAGATSRHKSLACHHDRFESLNMMQTPSGAYIKYKSKRWPTTTWRKQQVKY